MGTCASTPQRAAEVQPSPLLSPAPAHPPAGPDDSGRLGLPPRAKLVLLGDSGVGKSCLALRFTRGWFDPGSRATVGAAFSCATVTAPGGGGSCKLEIWDTAGQERYQSLAPLYYRGAHAAAIVYDITQRTTLVRAQLWLEELRRYAGHGMVLVLVGNKTDLALQRQVAEEEGRQLADSLGALFVETSCASGSNVAEVFEGVASRLAGGLPVSVNAAAALPLF
ncbi:hypothetical protein Agub_g4380 [Astrephomene gubernaculifera]|uniref:Uncharacterized protein n=1 Tax=Astrephomene gubernaculifera TaxID=47775 RepID=A0AAD3DMH9_9CHLO|nr:hypothetical protein Agub_g4380 [Astrephomene gubernaculifera]